MDGLRQLAPLWAKLHNVKERPLCQVNKTGDKAELPSHGQATGLEMCDDGPRLETGLPLLSSGGQECGLPLGHTEAYLGYSQPHEHKDVQRVREHRHDTEFCLRVLSLFEDTQRPEWAVQLGLASGYR